jgi:diguanylate cyclase (GGDEF)-like protein
MLCELESGDLAKKQVEAMLQEQALTDELTGLPNRRLLTERLSQLLAISAREKRIVAVLYIDLDGFKLVNDSLGHTVGDLLLVQVAQALRTSIRQSDTLARLGGDEFMVLLNGVHNKEDCERVANTLLDAFRKAFIVEGHEIVIGASIGISVFPEHGADVVTLLQHADAAMYAAKKNGKNQIRCFTPELGSIARERMTLENQMRGAISRGEISLHYQPEFDVQSGRLVRFEALARWTHPSQSPKRPDKLSRWVHFC